MTHSSRPLDGITVIELGQLIAGPFAGTLLAYFGATVIKVEPPEQGDPIRSWRKLDESGTSYWWYSIARNKQSVSINMRSEEGRDIVREMINQADVVIENFRPGTMEKWGLGPDDFKATNPKLIYSRISGYGQTGPMANRPGYASVSEAFSGFRAINGFPGQPPVRPNLSMGDTLAGFHAAFGILLSLVHRLRGSEQGQVVDVAIYESMYNMMEAIVPEYSGAGVVREPSGSTLTGIVPTNTYLCRDNKYVVIGGNGDSIFKRLMRAAGFPHMADDPRMANNAGRVKCQQEIDDAISQWTGQHNAKTILAILEEADVPSGPIYNVEDMLQDEQYNARGMFERVDIGGRELTLPAITPVLSETPGRTDFAGPRQVGKDTVTYLNGLGKSDSDIADLRRKGII